MSTNFFTSATLQKCCLRSRATRAARPLRSRASKRARHCWRCPHFRPTTQSRRPTSVSLRPLDRPQPSQQARSDLAHTFFTKQEKNAYNPWRCANVLGPCHHPCVTHVVTRALTGWICSICARLSSTAGGHYLPRYQSKLDNMVRLCLTALAKVAASFHTCTTVGRCARESTKQTCALSHWRLCPAADTTRRGSKTNRKTPLPTTR